MNKKHLIIGVIVLVGGFLIYKKIKNQSTGKGPIIPPSPVAKPQNINEAIERGFTVKERKPNQPPVHGQPTL